MIIYITIQLILTYSHIFYAFTTYPTPLIMSSSPSKSGTMASTRSTRSSDPRPLVAINSLVFDISGSTHSMGSAPVEQLHELMMKLKGDAIDNDANIQLSLHTFNHTVQQVIPSTPGELSVDMRTFEVPSLSELQTILEPRGMTALYDAGIIGYNHIENIYKQEWDKLSRDVQRLNPKITKCYVLSTDGMDNQSTHSISDFKKATLTAKENNVQPLFLFANIGSEMGKQMGFQQANAAQFDPTYTGVTNMLRATTNALRQYSSGQTQTIDSQALTQDTSPPTSPPAPPQYSSNGAPLMPGLPPQISLRQHACVGLGSSPPPLRRY